MEVIELLARLEANKEELGKIEEKVLAHTSAQIVAEKGAEETALSVVV